MIVRRILLVAAGLALATGCSKKTEGNKVDEVGTTAPEAAKPAPALPEAELNAPAVDEDEEEVAEDQETDDEDVGDETDDETEDEEGEETE
jgi:hypothetical protein